MDSTVFYFDPSGAQLEGGHNSDLDNPVLWESWTPGLLAHDYSNVPCMLRYPSSEPQ